MTSSALPLPGDEPAPQPAAARLHVLEGGGGDLAALPDGTLLELSRGGDRAAFGVLVERHHRMLAGLIRQKLGPHEPVEDLLQEAFAKALSNLDRFGGRSSFATWAGAIAINLATDWQRKQARRRRLAPTTDVEQDSVPAAGGSLRAVEVREEADRASSWLQVRVTQRRKARYVKAAKSGGQSLSAFIEQACDRLAKSRGVPQ